MSEMWLVQDAAWQKSLFFGPATKIRRWRISSVAEITLTIGKTDYDKVTSTRTRLEGTCFASNHRTESTEAHHHRPSGIPD
jgi:hypothetical protein